MEYVEDVLLASVAPLVDGHHPSTIGNLHPVDKGPKEQYTAGMLHRHAVAVGLEGHHAEPIGTDRHGAAAGKGMHRQREQVRSLLLPELAYGLGLTAQASSGFCQASPSEQVVELLEGVHLWHRDHVVAAGVPHQIFHQPLLMGLPRIAEPTLEEIVAPESDKGLLLLGSVSRQGFFHRLRHPVVPDGVGDTTEEIKGLIMSFEQGFLLLVGGSRQKRYLGEAQPPDEELDGEGSALHDHHGFAEVYLGIFAGLVGQRDEDRTLPGTVLAHVIPDGGLTPGIAMLLDKPVVDAPAGVMLLGRTELVLGKTLVYDGYVRAEHRPGPWFGKLVAGRTCIPDGRPDRAPVMVPLPGNLAYTLAFDEEGPANLLFLVHFKHLFPPVTGFPSSIPDSPGLVGVFSTITLPSGVGAFYPSIYSRSQSRRNPHLFYVMWSYLKKPTRLKLG